MIRAAFLAFCCSWSCRAGADFQPTGRVVDQADLLTPEQEAELTGRLEALERASSRQPSSPPSQISKAIRSRIMAIASAATGESAKRGQ